MNSPRFKALASGKFQRVRRDFNKAMELSRILFEISLFLI